MSSLYQSRISISTSLSAIVRAPLNILHFSFEYINTHQKYAQRKQFEADEKLDQQLPMSFAEFHKLCLTKDPSFERGPALAVWQHHRNRGEHCPDCRFTSAEQASRVE